MNSSFTVALATSYPLIAANEKYLLPSSNYLFQLVPSNASLSLSGSAINDSGKYPRLQRVMDRSQLTLTIKCICYFCPLLPII